MMKMNRYELSHLLLVIGAGIFALGLFLLAIKLFVLLAWHAAGLLAVVGLLMLLAAAMIGRK